MKKFKLGFTLIELLVVISIIGLISSIALASVKTARERAADGAIRQNLTAIKTQAQIVLNTYGTYGTEAYTSFCGSLPNIGTGVFRDQTIQRAIDASVALSGQTQSKCEAAGTTYVVAVPFKTAPTTGWCVDGVGNGKVVTMANFDDPFLVHPIADCDFTGGGSL